MNFIEHMARFFDEIGQGSMSGRVFGHLLVCQPPKQRAVDIQEATGASAGTVHGILKSYVSAGLVQRNSEAGSKTMWYEITQDAFISMLTARLEMIKKMVHLADLGLSEYSADHSKNHRLESMKICYEYFEQAFPAMIANYRKSILKDE